MRVTLGINNCFAVKRWPSPEEWSAIVRDELGLEVVQHCLDLTDLSGDVDIDAEAGAIGTACADAGLRIHSVFTGLVGDLGTVVAVDATADGVRLGVRTSLAGELREGDSVAVNGVCLTATAVTADAFSADVMRESLARIVLASARPRRASGSSIAMKSPLSSS